MKASSLSCRAAARSGTRPSAISNVIGHPTALKTALPADEATRAAAREALELVRAAPHAPLETLTG
ncbi:hypothetical protein [Nonomuraea sp. NPDC049695]|uniref:hypothetical protein n=1 Tax=Nonomuraea sp. NPDC049695 TaxID=3154734 RepID=UPI00344041EA